MKRSLFSVLFVLLSVGVFSQTKISLLPTTMRKYVGKVSKTEFEKLVGTSLGSEFPYVTYEVVNTHTNSYTNIECLYQESDSLLLSIHYPSKEFLGYWEAFEKFPGYSKKNGSQYWEAPDGSVFTLTLTYKNLQCEIIKERFLNYSIKYSIVQ